MFLGIRNFIFKKEITRDLIWIHNTTQCWKNGINRTTYQENYHISKCTALWEKKIEIITQCTTKQNVIHLRSSIHNTISSFIFNTWRIWGKAFFDFLFEVFVNSAGVISYPNLAKPGPTKYFVFKVNVSFLVFSNGITIVMLLPV